MTDDTTGAAGTRLIEMVRGYQLSQAIHAAAVLGVADHLGDGAQSAEALAEAVGAHAGALKRLMRVLASRGILVERDDERYELGALGQLMRTDCDGSVHGQLLLWGHPMQWVPWGDLVHSVRTGDTAFEKVFGAGHWEYLENNPDAGVMFKSAMAAHPSHRDVAGAYDFSDAECIADIGGGSGLLLAEILRANPLAHGILFDRPSVLTGAMAVLEAAGVAGRCDVRGGSFFDDMPREADAYVLSNVLMDWDDADAMRLLRRCRSAMDARARLVVIERMIPGDNAPSLSQLGDLMGLVITGGRVRSVTEFEALLEACGLRCTRAQLTPSGYTILEARPLPAA
ncbi:MAG: methyltransferase [bacterium]